MVFNNPKNDHPGRLWGKLPEIHTKLPLSFITGIYTLSFQDLYGETQARLVR